MDNFIYDIPTKVYFGKGQIKALGDAILEYGKKVLVVSYMKASPPELEIIAAAFKELEAAGIEYWHLDDVEPNPRITSVIKGCDLVNEHDIDLVLAIGGGSAIDCSKGIAYSAKRTDDPWTVISHYYNYSEEDVMPIGCISTMAATGSDMDRSAVISNDDTNEKLAIFSNAIFPRFAIMDPMYTTTVPAYQTACGGVDIISHICEVYFCNQPDAYFQNRMAEAMLKTAIKYTPIAVEDPTNYEARANLQWVASWAINGLLLMGKHVEWSVHPMEHEVSAYFPRVTHGAGIAAITPYWLEYVLDETTVDDFVDFAVNVWDIEPSEDKMETAKAGIQALKDFYDKLGMPKNLRELGVTEDTLEPMARASVRNNAITDDTVYGIKPLKYEDFLAILKAAY